MRLAAYAGTSVALAVGIVLKALHSRPNYYSVCVYFAESNAALMIISNLVLLIMGSLLVGLQHILYGPLRPIEIEQLYEKAWFAVTETCLAMTIFREELGVWFVVMFVSLLVAKVWGWIGEGRLEILEQQPPENPRLFHARLSISLLLSIILNVWLLNYSVDTVREINRPNVMVMFAFEFALLNVSSLSTAVRYGITVQEALIVRDQTNTALQTRRKQIEDERKAARDAAQAVGEPLPEEPPIEEVLDEADIDAPGWEDKSRWLFYLDLTTDFLRLVLYVTFFFVLCRLYGMPIHIIRDVALVVRSFYRRVTDFMKYRHATRDMHARYPDATAEEVASQDVCIICREEMTARPAETAPEEATPTPSSPLDERLRPKKLPCGHILHFSCLRSWLERQQNCPTCRQPVLSNSQTNRATTGANPQANDQGAGAGQPAGDNNQPPPGPGQANARLNRMRTFNLGPLRLTLATGRILPNPAVAQQPNEGARVREVRDRLLQLDARIADLQRQGLQAQQGQETPTPADPTIPLQPLSRSRNTPTLTGVPDSNAGAIQSSFNHLERMMMQDALRLRHQNEQLHVLRAMQNELNRLRAVQPGQTLPQMAGMAPFAGLPTPSHMSAFTANNSTEALQSGSTNLPPGVTIPEGWTLLPMQRMPEHNPMPAMAGIPMMNPEQQRSRSLGPSRSNMTGPQFNPTPSNLPSVAIQSPATPNTTARNVPNTPDPLSEPAQTESSRTRVERAPEETRTTRTPEINEAHQSGSVSAEESSTQATTIPPTSNVETSEPSGWQWPTSPQPADTPASAVAPAMSTETRSEAVPAHVSDTTDHRPTVEDAPENEQ